MVIKHQQPVKPQILFAWIVANFSGGFVVGFLEDNGLQFMATLVLAGAIVGSSQWLVLRRFGSSFAWWPLASGIGWILSTILQVSSSNVYRPIVAWLWAHLGLWEVFGLNVVTQPIAILGMAIAQIGLLVWRCRGQGKVVVIWLVASLLGAALQGAIGAALCAAACQALPNVLIGLVAGSAWASYGLITGLALWRLAVTNTLPTPH
ncbi:MAG: hypothetical protein AAGF24_04500 [Cyanobacteria bacterium P01_H01_bin.121]